MKIHPGGADWIRLTEGTDITEAVETHHIYPEHLVPFLEKYRVQETSAPRNCKLTFNDNGFYRTLRRRVATKLLNIDKTAPKVLSKVYEPAKCVNEIKC